MQKLTSPAIINALVAMLLAYAMSLLIPAFFAILMTLNLLQYTLASGLILGCGLVGAIAYPAHSLTRVLAALAFTGTALHVSLALSGFLPGDTRVTDQLTHSAGLLLLSGLALFLTAYVKGRSVSSS
ncbi:MAG: hypothetical protein GY774_35200 [Planctomycetes bacterium]|nr:hypothetical protein [Planctomycetota bacterium]